MRSFNSWIGYLDSLPGPDFEYLGPKGIIPPNAVLTSERKSNADSAAISDDEDIGGDVEG